MSDTESVHNWRALALRFHVISCMVSSGRLLDEFTPGHLVRMIKYEGISSGEYSVMRFLLHTWNGYDNPFELRDILGWDDQHLAALADWITGKSTGEPVRYF